MSDTMTAVESIRRARFEAEVTALLAQRNARQHALLAHFSRESEAFVKLQKDVLDHYFFAQRQLSPLFAVDAMASLADRMVQSMQANVSKAA